MTTSIPCHSTPVTPATALVGAKGTQRAHLCNLAGGVAGSTPAARRSSAFVRRIFLLVVSALVLSPTWKQAVS